MNMGGSFGYHPTKYEYRRSGEVGLHVRLKPGRSPFDPEGRHQLVRWQNGYVRGCNPRYVGSIPARTSNFRSIMANYKRKKSKKNVRCTLCTTYRWMGNTKERRPIRDRRATQREKK